MADRENIIEGLEKAVCAFHLVGYSDGTKVCNDAIAMLKEQPEIVRCKDCKFGGGCQSAKGREMIACFNDDVFLEPEIHEPDWFCGDGEKKQS